MSSNLIISLIIFAVLWFLIIWYCIKTEKISIKYSIIWFAAAIILFLVGAIPALLESISHFFGFLTISNLVIGIILSLLMIITLVLTTIVATQKNQIKMLIQEVSILKGKNNGK